MRKFILSIFLFTSFTSAHAQGSLYDAVLEAAERLEQDVLIKPMPEAEAFVDFDEHIPSDPHKRSTAT